MSCKEFRKLKKYLIVPLTLLGAYLYRLRGGGWGPKLPRPLDQILFSSFPCIILTGLARIQTALEPGFNWSPWILCWLLVCFWAVAWESSGHGGGMDLGTNEKEPEAGRTLEKVEYLIYPWLFNLVPRYWYDLCLITLSGLIVTIVPGIYVAVTGNGLAGLLIAFHGALKGLGYAIGRKIFGNTEAGELISGGLRWGAAALIWVYLL